MVTRFEAHAPETQEYEQRIKSLEQQAVDLELKYNRLQEKYM